MARKVSERVSESFEDSDRDDVFKYMDWLRSATLDASQSLRKNVVALLLLMAIFELIRSSSTVRLSISSFEISSNSVVIVLIPALVSFLYLQIVVASGQLQSLLVAFAGAFRKWSEKGEGNDLDMLVIPPDPLYWNISGLGRSSNARTSDRLEAFLAAAFALIILLGVLAFEAQAYYELYPKSIPHGILWLISVAISLFCLIMSGFDFWLSKPE